MHVIAMNQKGVKGFCAQQKAIEIVVLTVTVQLHVQNLYGYFV